MMHEAMMDRNCRAVIRVAKLSAPYTLIVYETKYWMIVATEDTAVMYTHAFGFLLRKAPASVISLEHTRTTKLSRVEQSVVYSTWLPVSMSNPMNSLSCQVDVKPSNTRYISSSMIPMA